MKFTESSKEATHILKSTLPKLSQFKLAINPYNYSLWYAYFSGAYPSLKKELQQTLTNQGTLSHENSIDLFKKHIINDLLVVDKKLENSYQTALTNMNESAQKTEISAGDLEQQLTHSLKHLEATDVNDEICSVINTIAEKTRLVSETTKEFKVVLNDAQKEITRLKQELKEARTAAEKDSLTKLFNRRHFDKNIEQTLSNRKPTDSVALLLIDVDHFKQFNDNYGHLMGDLVLKTLANVLMDAAKDKTYTPCRFGGEEFAILLPKASMQEAKILAENTRKKISLLKLKDKKSGTPISNITASFGLAFAGPEETPSTLIDRADKALYKAKQNGRNQVVSL